MTPSAAEILPALRHPNPRVRFECLGMLDHLADDNSLAAMIAATRDSVPRVRRMAVHALGCLRCKPSTLYRELNSLTRPGSSRSQRPKGDCGVGAPGETTPVLPA
jgi:hypothetical protein